MTVSDPGAGQHQPDEVRCRCSRGQFVDGVVDESPHPSCGATTRARMADAPTGGGRDEAREAVARWLYTAVIDRQERTQRGNVRPWESLTDDQRCGWSCWADELLSLPEVRRLLDGAASTTCHHLLGEHSRVPGVGCLVYLAPAVMLAQGYDLTDEFANLPADRQAEVLRLARLLAARSKERELIGETSNFPPGNPEKGWVSLRVEAWPHDPGANGTEYQVGVYTAADAARELRALADRCQQDWAEPECPWPSHPAAVTEGLPPALCRDEHAEVFGDPGNRWEATHYCALEAHGADVRHRSAGGVTW